MDNDAGFAGHFIGIPEGVVVAHEALDLGGQKAGGAGDIIREDFFAVAEGGVAGGLDLDGGTTADERDGTGCQQGERRREGAMIHWRKCLVGTSAMSAESEDADLFEGGAEFFDFGGLHGGHGEAQFGIDFAGEAHRGFDRDGVGGEFEEGGEEGVVALVDGASLEVAALEGELDHFGDRAGDDVGGDGDDANGTD